MKATPAAPGEARLSRAASAAVRTAIRLAGGNEVCFVCAVDDDGMITTARAVARGDVRSVLALPGVAERGEMLLHNHPSGGLEPSGADLEVAARVHGNGVGFAITDNDATRVYVVTEVPRAKAKVPVDVDAIDVALGPYGAIAQAMRAVLGVQAYEDRPAQRAMAAAVTRTFNDGGVALLEAGTGVGKSLGYLVPALRWAAANGERTIVSTNTITLQEQLVGQGPAIPPARAGRPAGALRAAQGMAQLPLPAPPGTGARRGRGAVRGRHRRRGGDDRRVGAAHHRRIPGRPAHDAAR